MTILEAMDDPKLFGPWFKRSLFGDSWATWKVFLAALFGLQMTEEQREVFAKHTGRSDVPSGAFGEAYAVVGRRGGKSLVSALVATYCAAFRSYPTIAPGETALVMLLASDRTQAKILLKYINAFFDRIPMLVQMVEARTADSISLTNGIGIEVHTSDYRSVRGPSVVCAICDELAFWPMGDSASPDAETLSAIRPAMATIPNAILLGASSPYARKGSLFEAHKTYFGQAGAPILVWQGATREMNPSVSRLVIAAAYLRDPASARAEYGAEFRSDIESFIPPEALEACIVQERYELPPMPGVNYVSFTDPSGGSRDSWPTAIEHLDGDTVILDKLQEAVPPFSPENVAAESAAMIRDYGKFETTGDAYAGEFPRELYAKHGVTYRVSERNRSQIYLEFLPLVMSGRVRLLNNKKLIAQLLGLERRTARGGRDSIDHGPGGHDDLANAVAGAAVLVMGAAGGILGLIVFEQLEAAGKLGTLRTQWQAWSKEHLFQFEAKIRGLQPTPAPQWKEGPLPPCPNCKATCTAKLSQAEYRCGECATQWFKEGHEPKPARGQRGEYLAGRLPSARSFKFPNQT